MIDEYRPLRTQKCSAPLGRLLWPCTLEGLEEAGHTPASRHVSYGLRRAEKHETWKPLKLSEANESNEHPTAIDLEDLKVTTIPHHFLSLPGAMTMRFGVEGLGGPEPPMAVAASSSKTLKARKILPFC